MGDRAEKDKCEDNPLGKTWSSCLTHALCFAAEVARDGARFSRVSPLKTFWQFDVHRIKTRNYTGYMLLPPTHSSRLNITPSYTFKYPSNEAMNNSAMRSATPSTANGLWLQVMKLVSSPGLIFPHFLSSQCKWRGINWKYWSVGLSKVLIVALVTAGGTCPPFPTALELLVPICLWAGLIFALFLLLVH